MMMKLTRSHLFASDPLMRRATHNSVHHNKHRGHLKLSDSLSEEYWELDKLASPYAVEVTIERAYLKRNRIQRLEGFGTPFYVLEKWANPGLPSFVAWRLRRAFPVGCEMNRENKTLVSPFYLPPLVSRQKNKK